MSRHRISICILAVLAFAAVSCQSTSSPSLVSEFENPSLQYHPWCYWWWCNGNIDKPTITSELESIKRLGFSTVLLCDSRGYHEDDEHLIMPPPANEWMSPEWLDLVEFAIREAQRLGLKVTLNIANHGGSCRGAWLTGADAPKTLVYQSFPMPSGKVFNYKLTQPELPYAHDIALFAVRYEGPRQPGNEGWLNAGDGTHTMLASSGAKIGANREGNIVRAIEVRELTGTVGPEGILSFDVPDGNWMLVRFASTVIPGFEYDVDILDPEAVNRHLDRITSRLKQRVGNLFGTTVTHLYCVSWEGSVPTWSPQFESDFRKFTGIDLHPLLPMLAGYEMGHAGAFDEFMTHYRRARNDMFRENFYGTVRDVAHANGLEIFAESGGPWQRKPAIFLEADQQEYLSVTDMPQGEFWYKFTDGDTNKTHLRGVAATAHTYGKPRASAEAFTHMTYHWSVYPHVLKRLGDEAFVDGINHFVWHTFSSSPEKYGAPGIEYFAGSHINNNVTWQRDADDFVRYLSRCQFLLQQGLPVADLAVWVGNRAYQHWGHYREHPYDGSTLQLPQGYPYDVMNTDVLLHRAQAVDGRIVLPDGMSYGALIVDPEKGSDTPEALQKISELEAAGVPIIRDLLHPQPPFLPDTEGRFAATHRKAGDVDIYFIVGEGKGEMTFRSQSSDVQVWDAVSGQRHAAQAVGTTDGRTRVTLDLPSHGSAFVVFNAGGTINEACPRQVVSTLQGPWNVSFAYHKLIKAVPPQPRTWQELHDLTLDNDTLVKYFSGTTTLSTTFSLDTSHEVRTLSLGNVVGGTARVMVNGIDCGVAWTAPWHVDISTALKAGANTLSIQFSNCWRNRLIGDCKLPPSERVTSSNLHYMQGSRTVMPWGWSPTIYSGYTDTDPLMSNGVLGPVTLLR